MQTNMPNAVINHHSQELSADARSVEFFTINVHFAKDNPKPDSAPYLKNKIIRHKLDEMRQVRLTATSSSSGTYRL